MRGRSGQGSYGTVETHVALPRFHSLARRLDSHSTDSGGKQTAN